MSKGTNVWYFHGAGIGGLFLALYTVESVYLQLPKKDRGVCVIVTMQYDGLYRQFLQHHPHVVVLSLNRRSFAKAYHFIFQYASQKNIIFYPPSFSPTPILFSTANLIFTLANKDNIIIGYLKKQKSIFDSLFSVRLEKDYHTSIFNQSFVAAKKAMPNIIWRKPSILYSSRPILMDKKYILIHPFPSNQHRTLPDARWRTLLLHLRKKYPEHLLIITGSEDDKSKYALIARGVDNVSFVDAYVSSIQETMGVVARSDLFIGVDTGITHLASIFEKKTIVIGNNSNPLWLPTYNKNAIILRSSTGCTCVGNKEGSCSVVEDGVKYLACVYNISDSEIYAAIDQSGAA